MIGSQAALIAEVWLILMGAFGAVLIAHHFDAPDYGEFFAGVAGAIVGAVAGYEGLVKPIADALTSVYNSVTNLL